MRCAKCKEEAVIVQGHQHLCDKHYRFGQMRATAKRHNKVVPAHEQLERMASQDMRCPDCGVPMNWRSKDGKATVASLQHYRNGSIAIVCLSCNTRHAFMEGDSYRDMPKDHKQCPSCNHIKPQREFYADNGRSGGMKKKSICKVCSNKQISKWKELNRERYNEYQRQYRAKRKAEGNPVYC